MSKRPRAWGFWTEAKLRALGNYLSRFAIASQKASNRVYLDLFAGRVDNYRRDASNRHFFGSTVLALEVDPQFTHLRFFELQAEAEQLERELKDKYDGDDRFKVVKGDCNEKIGIVLEELKDLNLATSPMFAFIDPCALDVHWSTLELLSRFKKRNYNGVRNKCEMLILFADPSIQRQYGAGADRSITRQYGNDDWKEIAKLRENRIISAEKSRFFYAEKFRHQLENELGYRTTMSLPVKSEANTSVYTLVFATDHEAGRKIMRWVLEDTSEDLFEESIRLQLTKLRSMRNGSDTQEMFNEFDFDDNDEMGFWMEQFSYRRGKLVVEPAKSLETLLEEFSNVSIEKSNQGELDIWGDT